MEHIVFEKKNLGLIALFLVLIAAVVLATTEEEHEEEMPLPDVKLTEIMPHSTQLNADGKALGFITLTNQTDETVDLSGWGLADRAYKVKYVFEIGTTLAGGENLTVYLAGKHGRKRHAAVCFLWAFCSSRGTRVSVRGGWTHERRG